MKQEKISSKKAMRILKNIEEIQSESQMNPLALFAAITITSILTVILIFYIFDEVSVSTLPQLDSCQGFTCQQGVSK